MSHNRPAVLGGTPQFDPPIELTSPTLEVDAELLAEMDAVFASGMLTNARHVREFERRAAEFMRVEHAVAVASCTAGLMLSFRCLCLEGEVVLPSFTFMASAHAIHWNGLMPVFADSDESTFNLDVADAMSAVSPRTSAISVTHIFGAPADVDQLQRDGQTAAGRPLPIIVDAAHAFGASYPDGTAVGSKGTAEVFSFSPTKPLTTGEGGLVTTHDACLAKDLRDARNYGNPGTYDATIVGLNARMTEIAAILGRHNLQALPRRLERRLELVDLYATRLRDVPGIRLQQIPSGAVSTYKDFSVNVDATKFGLPRADLARALAGEGVPTRKYFDPPVHRQTAYGAIAGEVRLPRADMLASSTLTLPLSSHMPFEHTKRVCDAIVAVHEQSDAIARTLARLGGEVPTN
jgi:dTDP-4-amino-4,6-dideoxygalactose transaminase